jgi:glycosyltransferase involved in cell wall biosynthesis
MNLNREQKIKVMKQSQRFSTPRSPEISVLLPTYNRSDDLLRTLEALENQTLAEELFEIIVVDDGSQDFTEKKLQHFNERTQSRFSYATLKKNGGPARARNVGLRMCRAWLVIIIGDDIEPEPSFVEKHLYFHKQNPGEEYAMLGYVSFPEELKANTFMRWLENKGQKYYFNFDELVPGQSAGPLFFYTCNVSLKMALLKKSGWFDESFQFASHEDLELGHRLVARGMQLLYDPKVRGYHWHKLSVDGISRRVYLMGYSAELYWQKVGYDSGPIKNAARKILTGISSISLAKILWNRLRNKKYNENIPYPLHWHILLFLSFFIGLSDALKKRSLRL